MSEPSEPQGSAPIHPADDRVANPVANPVAGDAVDDVDLDAVERDLDQVEAALARLDDGTYWTDEVTGEPIPDDALAENPTTRRA